MSMYERLIIRREGDRCKTRVRIPNRNKSVGKRRLTVTTNNIHGHLENQRETAEKKNPKHGYPRPSEEITNTHKKLDNNLVKKDKYDGSRTRMEGYALKG